MMEKMRRGSRSRKAQAAKRQARPKAWPKRVSESVVRVAAQSAAAALRTTKRDAASTGFHLQKPRWPRRSLLHHCAAALSPFSSLFQVPLIKSTMVRPLLVPRAYPRLLIASHTGRPRGFNMHPWRQGRPVPPVQRDCSITN